jgi:kynurenine formamidase
VTIEQNGYYMQEWRIIEHVGTHVDAPGHFTPGGRLSPELQLSELIVPAVVIDISRRAARDPDTVVTIADLRSFERKHGRIPRDAAVLMYSGWGAKVGDPMPTAAPTRRARCTSPASILTPPNGSCATGGSVASAWTRSASTRGTRPRSRRT